MRRNVAYSMTMKKIDVFSFHEMYFLTCCPAQYRQKPTFSDCSVASVASLFQSYTENAANVAYSMTMKKIDVFSFHEMYFLTCCPAQYRQKPTFSDCSVLLERYLVHSY